MARESPSCCYSCFLLCSALPCSARLFGGVTARLPHFLHSFLHFSDSAHPFQHPTSFSPLHAEGKNADSPVIIQLELLTGAILAVLNSLPTIEKDFEYSVFLYALGSYCDTSTVGCGAASLELAGDTHRSTSAHLKPSPNSIFDYLGGRGQKVSVKPMTGRCPVVNSAQRWKEVFGEIHWKAPFPPSAKKIKG